MSLETKLLLELYRVLGIASNKGSICSTPRAQCLNISLTDSRSTLDTPAYRAGYTKDRDFDN